MINCYTLKRKLSRECPIRGWKTESHIPQGFLGSKIGHGDNDEYVSNTALNALHGLSF